jgi:small redox-active disulfide protein 2
MIIIKVLGSGCANCKKVEAIAHEAVNEIKADARIEKVTDPTQIHLYPILATPGLVINEKLVSAGRIPTKPEIIGWIKQAAG